MKNLLIPAALCATQPVAVAGPATSESALITTPPASSPWEFRITPYAWLTAIDGSTGPTGFVSDIDAGFDDIFDVLEMAAALQFEARYGRWGFMADAFYAELGNSGTLPGPLKTNIDLDFEQFLGEASVFYRVSEAPRSFVDLYAGIRYNSISLDLEATSNGPILQRGDQRSGDKNWTDPIVGLRGQWNINDKWYLAGKGDIGGFGVSSDFTWNLQATVGYNFTECVSAEIGYRYFDTDYDDGFTYDIAQAGLLLGLSFRF
jgi:opacity protein-like surface antigen